jgi:hypothetical protein
MRLELAGKALGWKLFQLLHNFAAVSHSFPVTEDINRYASTRELHR